MKNLFISLSLLFSLFYACSKQEIQPSSNSSDGSNVNVAVTDRAPAGWSSQTGYRHASTPVQIAVVSLANSYAVGTSPGLSQTGGCWLTDMASGDGLRHRNAINRYDLWYRTQRLTVSLATCKQQMINCFSSSAYNTTSKNLIVDRIISVYNGIAVNASVAVPTNDNQTLNFLSYRRQCFEFANKIAVAAGGQCRPYSTGGQSAANYRPGMALYKTNGSHSMIITDIYWNASGVPTKVKVRESNYCTSCGFNNPTGQVPWQRTVNSREVTLDSTVKVVSFQ